MSVGQSPPSVSATTAVFKSFSALASQSRMSSTNADQARAYSTFPSRDAGHSMVPTSSLRKAKSTGDVTTTSRGIGKPVQRPAYFQAFLHDRSLKVHHDEQVHVAIRVRIAALANRTE